MELIRTLSELLPLLSACFFALTTVLLLYLRSRFVSHSTCKTCREKIETRQYEIELRVAEAEKNFSKLATAEAVSLLASSVNGLAQEFQHLCGQMLGVSKNLDLLLQVHTVEKGK